MTAWICECGQVCEAKDNPTDSFPKWKDGHICVFKKVEGSRITQPPFDEKTLNTASQNFFRCNFKDLDAGNKRWVIEGLQKLEKRIEYKIIFDSTEGTREVNIVHKKLYDEAYNFVHKGDF
jgi:hypothetical protein